MHRLELMDVLIDFLNRFRIERIPFTGRVTVQDHKIEKKRNFIVSHLCSYILSRRIFMNFGGVLERKSLNALSSADRSNDSNLLIPMLTSEMSGITAKSGVGVNLLDSPLNVSRRDLRYPLNSSVPGIAVCESW